MTLLNNEIGFTAADVRSICDLGQSSKLAQENTIGRKGLGFKSVFMVAHSICPVHRCRFAHLAAPSMLCFTNAWIWFTAAIGDDSAS